jgi:formamidopyrimidine-DNA glycosylase
MPELPEVEVLARHLRPLVTGKVIREVTVRRKKVVQPTAPAELQRTLIGAKFTGVSRRGKYLLFTFRPRGQRQDLTLLGHLGMTGRMYLAPAREALPKHAAVVLGLGRERFIYEDTRYFGRFTLDLKSVKLLGPEPLEPAFDLAGFARQLKRFQQAIKVKLLDQSLVAGVGNIYASEALFLARISPKRAARGLTATEVARLHAAIRQVLAEAIQCGSTIPLNFGGGKSDGLFYYGSATAGEFHTERLLVYDRQGQPCTRCGTPIRRIVQAARSTFFCPTCQRK